MLPAHVTLIPQYVVFQQLGMIDTFVPLILPKLLRHAIHHWCTLSRWIGPSVEGYGDFGNELRNRLHPKCFRRDNCRATNLRRGQ